MSAHFPDEDALRESVYQKQAKVEFDALNARLAKAWAENKRYREALEEIANKDGAWIADGDNRHWREIARAALDA